VDTRLRLLQLTGSTIRASPPPLVMTVLAAGPAKPSLAPRPILSMMGSIDPERVKSTQKGSGLSIMHILVASLFPLHSAGADNRANLLSPFLLSVPDPVEFISLCARRAGCDEKGLFD